MLLRDPLAAHLKTEGFLLPRPDGAARFSELMRRRILDVRADREAGGVRLVVDGVAELRGLDERLAALLCGADGGLPSAPVRAFALVERSENRIQFCSLPWFGVLRTSGQGGSRKRIAAKQRKENAVFLGMESGWRTNASFDFIEPSARPQFHRNGV